MSKGLPVNEFGFSICEMPRGGLVKGPTAWGTPTTVSIPIQCPPGASFKHLFHSHPGGISFPSNQDLQSALKVGADTLCILSERDGLVCFKVRQE